MPNIAINTADAADELLGALAEQLAARGTQYDLVVVGGSALLALGLISRPTRDVDVVGIVEGGTVQSAEPLPAALVAARDLVARDFDVPRSWLNGGPTSLLDLGLPVGFLERASVRSYGPYLTVLFASRIDQIHFKLYAMVDDGGPGKHERDLRALNPEPAELLAAARWSMTQDVSDAYRETLRKALHHLGVEDADLRP
jgi:Nucleotidyltransferase of unknown function (DUF6036)